MTTWRQEIETERNRRGDGPILTQTLSGDELDLEFDNDYGLSNGKPFTAWSAVRVYFPAVYDGAEWCASAPRNPSDEVTSHVGGE